MRVAISTAPVRAVMSAAGAAALVLLLGAGSACAQEGGETPPPPEPALQSLFSNMRLRGYSDIGFGRPLQEKLPEGGLQASHSSFQIADLHMFFTSKLSKEWSFLSEVLVTSDFSNSFEIEVDRLLIAYKPNAMFKVGLGKFNAGIGFYPNEFHRAKFYQTATGRPLMFTDEDNGGILPVHTVGVTVTGEIPSGEVGLHYLAEVTNGRAYADPSGAQIQNWSDEDNWKAVNAGLFVRPELLAGFQAGFSVYYDRINPPVGRHAETITSVHAVYVQPNLELLNEAVVLRHSRVGGSDRYITKSFYSQASRRFGVTRPYVRYEYQNVPAGDPVFGTFGLRKAVSGGVHFDIGQFAVVKAQLDRALQYGRWATGAHAQLAFAF